MRQDNNKESNEANARTDIKENDDLLGSTSAEDKSIQDAVVNSLEDIDGEGFTTAQKLAIASAIAIALTVSSPKAHAGGLSDAIKKLSEQLTKGLEYAIGPIMGILGQVIGVFLGGASAANSMASTKAAESEMDFHVAKAEKEVLAATELPPDPCESNELGETAIKTTNNSTIISSGLAKKSVESSVNNTPAQKMLKLGKAISQRYPAGSENENKHFNASTLTGGNQITSAANRKAGLDFIEVATATAQSSIDVQESDASSSSGARRARYLHNSSYQARLELAKAPLISSLSDRLVLPGEEHSKLSSIEREVARTYGGASNWRNELAGYANPTPLVAELNKQMAFSNHLQAEILKKSEIQTHLSSSILVELMSTSTRQKSKRKLS